MEPWSILLVLTCWLAFGALATVVMRRRGHDSFTWAVLFLFLGPLAFAVASGRATNSPVPQPTARLGALDILIADDGSPNAREAVDVVLSTLSGLPSSFTIATVIDLDAAGTIRGAQAEVEAREHQDATRARIQARTSAPVDVLLLRGPAAATLEDFAATYGYELIVVGSRGRGASRALVGSVAEHLVAHSRVPVLVGNHAVIPDSLSQVAATDRECYSR